MYRKQLGTVSETLTTFKNTEPILISFLIRSFQLLFVHGTTCRLKQERHQLNNIQNVTEHKHTDTTNYFNAGTCLGQILHARLRMDCSSLNSDLNRKRVVPSPYHFEGFESVQNFLFTCPNHTVARERYLLADLRN